MKKILIIVSLMAASFVNAQSFTINSNTSSTSAVNTGFTLLGGSSYTQNTDSATITPANSVSCNGGGLHTDNSYLRRFDLDGDHGVTGLINVDSVDVGIETAAGATGSQPVEVRLYSINNASALEFVNMTLIGTLVTTVADASAVVQNFVVTGGINGLTDDLVVEFFTPEGQTDGNSFFIGSNDAGQSAPSYIFAAACGLTAITSTGDIGFGNMHIVMVVNATAVAPAVPVPTLSWLSIGLMLMLLVFVTRRQLQK